MAERGQSAATVVGKTKIKKSKPIVLKAHHRKPYRRRHLVLLTLALLVLVALSLQAGIAVGRTQPTATPVEQATPQVSVSTLRSSYGFWLALDANSFDVAATRVDDKGIAHTATPAELRATQPLTTVVIKPRKGTVPRIEAATQLQIQVDPNADALTRLESLPANVGLTPAAVAAQLFPVTATTELDATVVSSKAETLNSVPVQKTVYQFTPKFSGGISYAVVWTAVSHGRAVGIKLQGLVGDSSLPSGFASVINSLVIDGDQSVQGASTDITKLPLPKASASDATTIDSRYLSDALSPAVVKIYSVTCGVLNLGGQPVTNESCVGSSGSGFFVSKDGYIATNGHVVTYTAQDALVDIITSDQSIMTGFLENYAGFTAAQVTEVENNPTLLASVIAKIYDLPATDLSLSNQQQVTMVSIGSTAPDLAALMASPPSHDLRKFSQETQTIKRAKIIGTDYAAKDLYTAVADPTKGFSSSDVALIKVDVNNAPTITLSSTDARQNEKILVIGFPGDADNSLTDNTSLSVSVTDGSISSIREAAGGNGKLYQSDVDASHGNSGGPAIGDDGTAIGLLTYRYSDGVSGNAAKSYIRDINDFRNLALSHNVKLQPDSDTQVAWEKGLSDYSTNHYSKALKQFAIVQKDFPSHRLVDSYIDSAQQSIDAGKDVKDMPVTLLIAGVAVALLGAAAAVVLIARHHGRHKLYKANQHDMPDGKPGPQGFTLHPPLA
ncbi:MAG: exported protein of unknown function [Candidatus Saccharibacteria bacterium]|nr:exported protein of unknown function [Candidatus Saccharibacteria bacterium]